MDQLIIKILLIAAFLVLAFFLLRPAGSARRQAMRTITLLLLLLAAIVAVIFPGLVNEIAITLGVGRGTDLLLYGIIVVFIASTLSAARHRRAQDERITELARRIALQDPILPDTDPGATDQ